MPRYFFHVHHDRAQRDTEGEELPDKLRGGRQPSRLARFCKGLTASSTQAGNDEWKSKTNFGTCYLSCISMQRNRSKSLTSVLTDWGIPQRGHFVMGDACAYDN